MVSAGQMSFTGEKKADAAWRQFVKPGVRIGFKLNLLGRPLVVTACWKSHRGAHGGNCDPYITETYEHFAKATKTPLILLDAAEG